MIILTNEYNLLHKFPLLWSELQKKKNNSNNNNNNNKNNKKKEKDQKENGMPSVGGGWVGVGGGGLEGVVMLNKIRWEGLKEDD